MSSPVKVTDKAERVLVAPSGERVIVRTQERVVVKIGRQQVLVRVPKPNVLVRTNPQGPPGPAGAASAVDLAANCLASDAVEDLVYITGPDVAGILQVTKIDIDDGAKMPAAGVIVAKATPTSCTVRFQGEFDLAVSAFTPGSPVFASASGILSTTPPTRPGVGSRFIQRLGVALTGTKLVIMPAPLVHEILP